MIPETKAEYDIFDKFRWEEKNPERREWWETRGLQKPSGISNESLEVCAWVSILQYS